MSQDWEQIHALLVAGDTATAAQITKGLVHPDLRGLEPIQLGSPPVYPHRRIPTGWMYLEPGIPGVAVVNDMVLEEFGASVYLFRYARRCNEQPEPTFLGFSLGNWRTLEAMDEAEFS